MTESSKPTKFTPLTAKEATAALENLRYRVIASHAAYSFAQEKRAQKRMPASEESVREDCLFALALF